MISGNKARDLSVPLLCLAAIFAPQPAAAQEHELRVTASKQSPYAASSQNVAAYRVSSDQLASASVHDTLQLSKVLPGVNTGKSDSLLFPQTAIRGISSLDFYNSALTIYLDGIPQPSVAFSSQLLDVKAIEMLKGPQSTLYGKAAQGGIVNIVSEQPAADYNGYLSSAYTSRDGYRLKANLSGPVKPGWLYASITGLRQVENGRLTNPGTGHHRLTGSSDTAGALRLRLAPDHLPWEITAAIISQCTDSSEGLYVPFHQLRSDQAIAGQGMPDPELHRCIRSQSLRAQYDQGLWLLHAIASWQQVNYSYLFPNPGADGPLLNKTPSRWWLDIQEVRASTQGADNPLDVVAGLYREAIRDSRQDRFSWGDAIDSMIKQQTLAAYGDLTWHLSRQWDLGAGLRFSQHHARLEFKKNAAASLSGNSVSSHLSGQVSAGYQISRHNRVYARIAQGYQAGGFDHGALSVFSAYQPETSLSYELGHRYQSGWLNLQGAVFYTQTHDIQMYRGVTPFQSLQNGGDATALGLELSGDYTFVPGWKLAANLTLTQAEFSHDEKNNSPAGQFAGKKLPFVPDYSGGIALTGDIDTRIGTLSPYLALNINGGYDYKDSTVKQAAWSTTDIRLSWQINDRIRLSACVDNLFDKRFASYAFDMPAAVFASVNNGRTAGLEIKIDMF